MKKFYNRKLLFITFFGFLFNVNILFANQVDVTFENGDRYIGEVLNNKKHGSGTYIESGPDGKEYKGEWKNDKQHGKGFLKQSGMEYTGDFFEGKIQGKGVLVDKDGKYEGEFLNGMMHGIGVLKLNDGRIVRGEFKNNKYVGASKKITEKPANITEKLDASKATNILEDKIQNVERKNNKFVGLQKGTETLKSDWVKLCKASKKYTYTELNLSTEAITECDYLLKTGDDTNIPNIYSELEKVKMKIIEGEKKKAKRKKELEIKTRMVKEIRDLRGKWGIHFNMMAKDIEGCKGFNKVFKSSTVCWYDDKQHGRINIDFEKIKDVFWVDKLTKHFGQFNSEKFSEFTKRLSKKYNLVYEPSKAEKEDFLVSERPIEYLFENKINENEPKYILLSARYPLNRIMSYIKISYLSEHYGYSLVEQKKKKESYLDDL